MAKFEDQLDRFRTEEFWDRVMQELAEFLAQQGPLTPGEILPDLRSVMMGGATLHKEPLTPAILKLKGECSHVFDHVNRYTPDGRVPAQQIQDPAMPLSGDTPDVSGPWNRC